MAALSIPLKYSWSRWMHGQLANRSFFALVGFPHSFVWLAFVIAQGHLVTPYLLQILHNRLLSGLHLRLDQVRPFNYHYETEL